MGPSLFDSDVDGRNLLSETGPYENPLIPNKKLRQMYVAMVEARVLDEHIAGMQRGVKGAAAAGFDLGRGGLPGEHGDRAGTGDLVSDAQVGV